MKPLASRLLAAALVLAPVAPFALPAPAAAQSRDGDYVVQEGDTLRTIARALGVDLDELLGANPGLRERDLQPGRRLEFGDRFEDRGRGPVRARVDVDSREAVPGGVAVVRVDGLPPRLPVTVEASGARVQLEGDGEASRGGRALVELDIPRRARPGDRFEVEVYGPRDDLLGRARFRVAEGFGDGDRPLRLSGTLTDDGGVCPTLRTERGERFALSGPVRPFRSGDRVTVTGQRADASICNRRDTIDIDRIEAGRR